MKKIKLPIIDLFPCIQGEGILAGVPHILVRTSGCNLRCSFKQSICDTAYSSWNPEKGKYEPQEVFDMLEANPQIKHVMITGGEPLIHTESLYRLIDKLHAWKINITVETNGTLYIPIKTLKQIALVSVSPKLASSNPFKESIVESEIARRTSHEGDRISLPNLIHLAKYSRKIQFKFVYTDEKDVEEIKTLMSSIEDAVGNELAKNIMLMPEGTERYHLQNNRQRAIEICIENGWRYTDRLHIIAYGNERNA